MIGLTSRNKSMNNETQQQDTEAKSAQDPRSPQITDTSNNNRTVLSRRILRSLIALTVTVILLLLGALVALIAVPAIKAGPVIPHCQNGGGLSDTPGCVDKPKYEQGIVFVDFNDDVSAPQAIAILKTVGLTSTRDHKLGPNDNPDIYPPGATLFVLSSQVDKVLADFKANQEVAKVIDQGDATSYAAGTPESERRHQYYVVFKNDMNRTQARQIASKEGLTDRQFSYEEGLYYPVSTNVPDGRENEYITKLSKLKGVKRAYRMMQDRPLVCLPSVATIDTPNGEMPVKYLRVGDKVWTEDLQGRRIATTIVKTSRRLVRYQHHMVHIVLSDGRQLTVSASHPTINGRPLGALETGQQLDGGTVTTITVIPYEEHYTYDLLPEGVTGYYWADNILIGSTLANKQ